MLLESLGDIVPHIGENGGFCVLTFRSGLGFKIRAVGVAGDISLPSENAVDESVFSFPNVLREDLAGYFLKGGELGCERIREIDKAFGIGLVAKADTNPFLVKIDVIPVQLSEFGVRAEACEERNGEPRCEFRIFIVGSMKDVAGLFIASDDDFFLLLLRRRDELHWVLGVDLHGRRKRIE